MNSNKTAQRLLKTGWQSWSWDYPGGLVKFPRFNYPFHPITNPQIPKLTNIKLKKPARGWCSWYSYGPNINNRNINANVNWFSKNPLQSFEYILIDDGWSSAWGDWLQTDRKKFPQGLKTVAKQIKQKGFKPGIWVAPFLVDPKSDLVRNNPSWIIKDKKGFVNGLKFTPFDRLLKFEKYILDIENKQVQKFIENTIDYLLGECQFELIKLDFLYGIYFNPVLNNEICDQFLKDFFLRIKKKFPKVYTIACGSPLIPAIGLVDSIRIGPDTLIPQIQHLPLISKLTNKFLHSQIMKNISKRKFAAKFWNLDPDVFLCNPKLGLTDSQLLQLQQEITNLKTNIFLGDNMYSLSEKRVKKFIKPLFSA